MKNTYVGDKEMVQWLKHLLGMQNPALTQQLTTACNSASSVLCVHLHSPYITHSHTHIKLKTR